MYNRLKTKLRIGEGNLEVAKKRQSKASAKNAKAKKIVHTFSNLFDSGDSFIQTFHFNNTVEILGNPDVHSEDEAVDKKIVTHPKTFLSQYKKLEKLKAYLGQKMKKK